MTLMLTGTVPVPLPLDEIEPWNATRQMLVCTSVVDEAPEVKTFTFAVEDGGWFRYMPGQFITVELRTKDGDLHAPTVSSSRLGHTRSRSRQGTANLSWHTLDVRKCSARLAYPRLWAEWAFHPDAPSGEEVPLHLSWIWHHADDVHVALAIRLRPWG